MFFTFPIVVSVHMRQLALLVNTGLLIAALIIIELVYSERPKEQRVHLRYFYPLCVILGALLVYAAWLQGAKG